MLRNFTPDSGLGFAGEFHQGRALAAGVRAHDRLADVAGRGQHLLPLQEQLRAFRATGSFLCRGLDPDGIARGFSWTANPENEGGAICRWRSAHCEAGFDPYLLVMSSRNRRNIRRKRPRNSRAIKRNGA